ncbi:MAG TPA: rod shape-determining protein [Gemmatimonadales bacterium]|nr:rod shape-determining protein [Gemmatimonadales bacterium]
MTAVLHPHPAAALAAPSRPLAAPAFLRRIWRPATDLAVDLGTANTLVVVQGEGLVLDEPTVAAVGPGGEVLGAGLDAKRMIGRAPAGVRVIRPLKDGVIADFSVAEQLLRTFLRRVLDRHLIRMKPSVLVCVPSCITDVERRAVRDAARSAGAKRLRTVDEPVAAAIGAGLPVNEPSGSLVVDVGGGTTDVAVLSLGSVVCDASIRTGGDAMDQAIVQFLRKHYNLLVGDATAERVKLALGSAAPFEVEQTLPVRGRDLISGLPRTVTVESVGVRDAMHEPVQRIVNAVRRVLEATPPELSRDLVDRGIVLTGGGAMIRGLDALLTYETGLPVRVDLDPLTSVVRGTGMILGEPGRWADVLAA